jgi:hypothetical protein
MSDPQLVTYKGLAEGTFGLVHKFAAKIVAAPTSNLWFQEMLVSILESILREYEGLKRGCDGRSITLLAWACRNMLELNIIAKFVMLSYSNAQDFAEDMAVDGFEFFTAFREWYKGHHPAKKLPELELTIANFEAEIAKRGITRGYLKMASMATTVGSSHEFQHMNKAMSKLVHPTSLSVLGQLDRIDELRSVLLNFMFITGVRYGIEAFNEMSDYVDRHGVEPRKPITVP